MATILLATTLLAMGMAVVHYVPCVGGVALFVGPPTVLRAVIVGYYRRRAGENLSVGDKIELVVVSFYAVLVSFLFAVVCAAITWFLAATVFTVATGLAAGGEIMLLCGLLGGIGGLAAFAFTMWNLTFPLEIWQKWEA